jgi:ribokinase
MSACKLSKLIWIGAACRVLEPLCETAPMQSSSQAIKVAVVGHVEWVQFAHLEHVPTAGEVVHATDAFEEPAGGGGVAAVQLARLVGSSTLLTAFGADEPGRRSVSRLEQLGVRVCAAERALPTRRALTLVDQAGERTITTFGERLEPLRADAELPWEQLGELDAVYFTAGDLPALRAARAARVLVASPRAFGALGHGVPLDALVFSAGDAIEVQAAERVKGEAALVVRTEGKRGGTYITADGRCGSWEAAPLAAAVVDSYGCGDSFAAGLTFALGAGLGIDEALLLAARCGAVCLTGRGPYEHQYSLLAV